MNEYCIEVQVTDSRLSKMSCKGVEVMLGFKSLLNNMLYVNLLSKSAGPRLFK